MRSTTAAALAPAEAAATADWIAAHQRPSGLILWFEGGHADPWNHVEAAMALAVTGRVSEAERAMEWLAGSQHRDGSWCHYYLARGVEEPRRDTNVCAYVATGVWWHWLATGDVGFLEEMWPVIDRAMAFVVRWQRPRGEVQWAVDPDGTLPGRFALLTGSSSVLHSLRCGVAIAEELGHERPEWELASGRLAHCIANRPEAFEPKDRWAMDWYYPVLSGAVAGDLARQRLSAGWDRFVMEGLGVRCVADSPWVTAAETAECAMAHDAAGLGERASLLLEWTRHLRDEEAGGYWTGCVHPQCVRFPGGERSTYTSAAVVIADHILHGDTPASGIFRGEGLPPVLDLDDVED